MNVVHFTPLTEVSFERISVPAAGISHRDCQATHSPLFGSDFRTRQRALDCEQSVPNNNHLPNRTRSYGIGSRIQNVPASFSPVDSARFNPRRQQGSKCHR